MSISQKSHKPSTASTRSSIEDDERRTSRNLVVIIGVALVAALFWAATFSLEEITRGTGKVIP
ncbi:MAG: hypothetical protein ACK5V9_00515, partial [Burkholderiales bacterium]